MSNTYTRFSFAVPLDNDEQRTWAEKAVAYIEEAAENGEVQAPLCKNCGTPIEQDGEGSWAHSAEPPADTLCGRAHVGLALLASSQGAMPDDLYVILPNDDYINFDVEVDSDGLWFHTDESGQPEHVVPLVQEFLRQFRPDGYVGFEWADYSDKQILDGFGGGAVLITATDQKWMASSTWLAEQMHALTPPATVAILATEVAVGDCIAYGAFPAEQPKAADVSHWMLVDRIEPAEWGLSFYGHKLDGNPAQLDTPIDARHYRRTL